jgi:hypothetical protein
LSYLCLADKKDVKNNLGLIIKFVDFKTKDMEPIENFMINVEVMPKEDSCPLKQVEECINTVKSFLSSNLYSSKSIFKVNVALKPDFIFTKGYLKAIVSQHLNMFFNYEPPIITYSESTNDNGIYFGLGLECFNDSWALKANYEYSSKYSREF